MNKTLHLLRRGHIIVVMAITTVLLEAMPMQALATNQPYARLDGSTLTFYYDENKEQSTQDFSLNTGTEDPEWNAYNNQVITVKFDESFKSYAPTTCYKWFYGMSTLSSIEGIENLNTAEVTNMSNMFRGCCTLTTLNVSGLNTEKVEDMNGMFSGCTKLKGIDVSNFNTAAVTNMSSMFAGCATIYELNLSNFNTENVIDMSEMFSGCTGLQSLGSISTFNTSKVEDMHGMFDGCTKIRAFYIRKFSTSAVKDMSAMFRGCTSLLYPYFNFDTANVENMAEMFKGCQSLTEELDITNFNTAKVKNMYGMFQDCRSLPTLDVSNFNTESVKDMGSMFAGCKSLTTLNLASFNTAKVTSMASMFAGCTALTTIMVLDSFTTAAVTSSNDMFDECTSLIGAVEYNAENANNATYANYTDGYLSYGGIMYARKANGTLTFYYNSDYKDGDYKVTSSTPGWSDSQTYNRDITKVVFDKSFSKARPTTTLNWFIRLAALESIEGMENLNTSEVTNMAGMFQACNNLKSVDLSHFNTDKVTNMNAMFYNCTTLKTLDLSSFNTSKVTEMLYMFSTCRELTTIYVSKYFTASNGTDMFRDCNKLKGAKNFNSGEQDAEQANYYTGYLTKKAGTNGTDMLTATGSPLTIENLAIDDSKTYMLIDDEEYLAATASYSRYMSSTWGTLCLPFAINAASDTNTCNFYSLKSVDAESVSLQQIETGTIEAGTPVIICKKDESAYDISITATNAAVVKAPVTSTEANRLVGTFTDNILTSDGGYFIAKDKFYSIADYATEGVIVIPFHAYIQTSDTATHSPMLSIVDGGSTTGIDATGSIDALNNAATEYYDMSGCRIGGLQKGINIVKTGNKTRKIIVK